MTSSDQFQLKVVKGIFSLLNSRSASTNIVGMMMQVSLSIARRRKLQSNCETRARCERNSLWSFCELFSFCSMMAHKKTTPFHLVHWNWVVTWLFSLSSLYTTFKSSQFCNWKLAPDALHLNWWSVCSWSRISFFCVRLEQTLITLPPPSPPSLKAWDEKNSPSSSYTNVKQFNYFLSIMQRRGYWKAVQLSSSFFVP